MLPGRRVVLFTTNVWGVEAAQVLEAAGAEIVEIADPRTRVQVTGTEADAAVVASAAVLLEGRHVDADLLLVSGGWNPNVALWSQSRGTLRFDDALGAYVPDAVVRQRRDRRRGRGRRAAGRRADLARLMVIGETHFVDLERDATVADLGAPSVPA